MSSFLLFTSLVVFINLPLINSVESDERVDVAVYYETLCPFSRNFIKNQVFPAYEKLSPIMNLKMIPFGNTYITVNNDTKHPPDVVFECQHGHRECEGNRIQACSFDCMEQRIAMKYVNCIFEHKLWYNTKKSSAECAANLKIDFEQLKQCSDSDRGIKLQLVQGNLTRQLNPPHTYVPWLTINGVHDKKVQKDSMNDLKKVICSLYNGEESFEGCVEYN